MSLVFSFFLLFLLFLFVQNRLILVAASVFFIFHKTESYYELFLFFGLLIAGQVAAEAITRSRHYSKQILFFFNAVSVLLFLIFKIQAEESNMVSNIARSKMPFGFSVLLFVINGYLIELFHNPKLKISWRDYYSELLFYPRLIIGPLYSLRKFPVENVSEEEKERSRLLGLTLLSFGLFQFSLSGLIGSGLGNGYILTREQMKFYQLNPWIMMVSATVFLYLNFSGFSYLVMGLCKMTNREPVMNFRFPFGSRSMKIFWMHWHESLGKWFQQYVYFPLQSDLIKIKFLYKYPRVLNFLCSFLVFTAIGAWHDVSLKMLLWSAFNTLAVSFINIKNKWLGVLTTNILIVLICGLFMSKSIEDYFFIVDKIFSAKAFFFNPIVFFQLIFLVLSLTAVYFMEKFTLQSLDESTPLQSRTKLFLFAYFCLVIALTLGLSNIDLTYDGFKT